MGVNLKIGLIFALPPISKLLAHFIMWKSGNVYFFYFIKKTDTMNERVKKIREIISPLLTREGIYLVDIELRGFANNQVLSIFVDTETGITMDQVTHLTQEIEGILDVEDPIPGRYRLEVSSPGIDRPLTEKWQYRKNIGRQLKVNYLQHDQKVERTGILKDVLEDKILLVDHQQEVSIPFSQISRAIVKINL